MYNPIVSVGEDTSRLSRTRMGRYLKMLSHLVFEIIEIHIKQDIKTATINYELFQRIAEKRKYKVPFCTEISLSEKFTRGHRNVTILK